MSSNILQTGLIFLDVVYDFQLSHIQNNSLFHFVVELCRKRS